MLSALRRLFAPSRTSALPPTGEALADLTRRVRLLESERLELLTEWTKTRDQVIRYMKRAGQLRASQAVSGEGSLDDTEPEDGEQLALEDEVLRLKLHSVRQRA